MFTGPVGPVEVSFYWPEAVLGNFYWPGAIGSPLASSPAQNVALYIGICWIYHALACNSHIGYARYSNINHCMT